MRVRPHPAWVGLFIVAASCAAPANSRPLMADEIHTTVVGKTVDIGGTLKILYAPDGSYFVNGRNVGRYRIEDGRICMDFIDGRNRCDQITDQEGTTMLTNRQGLKYSMRVVGG